MQIRVAPRAKRSAEFQRRCCVLCGSAEIGSGICEAVVAVVAALPPLASAETSARRMDSEEASITGVAEMYEYYFFDFRMERTKIL